MRNLFAPGTAPPAPRPERDVALEAAVAAGPLLAESHERARDHLVRRLATAFPADGIWAGPSVTDRSAARRRWLVDPVDGRRSFLARESGYAIVVTLLHDGEPALAVIHDPVARETWWAERGAGLHGVSRGAARGRLLWNPFLPSAWARELAPWLGFHGTERCESLGLRAVRVACSKGALLLVRPGAGSLAATAAAHLVVREAGGTCTDLHHRPFDFRRATGDLPCGLVASRGVDHSLALSRLRAHPWGSRYQR